MKCFISAAPFIWADKEWWYADKRDLDWEVFMPTMDKWNNKRVKLSVAFLLMFDEVMSGWCCPKTSKFGGFPNWYDAAECR